MIFNLTQGQANKTPVLDENYPADVTINDGSTTSATFKVAIAENGRPSEYTYQWYVDDVPVDGATGTSLVLSDLIKAATKKVYCLVTNKAGVVQSRTATLSVKHTLLYKNGTRYDDVTGGFVTAAKKNSSSSSETASSPTITYNTSNFKISQSASCGGIVYAKNKIDLTNLKTLHIKGVFYVKDTNNRTFARPSVWSALGTYAGDNLVASWTTSTAKSTSVQNVSINVSSLTGNHYIGFFQRTSGTAGDYYMQISEMWLEG